MVGAGFAGATLARSLAEASFEVQVIDRRAHIGGNAFDYVNDQGERVHLYGPHLLHGRARSKAVEFLSRFANWVPYRHKVRAYLPPPGGVTVPFPVNTETLETVFGVRLQTQAAAATLIENLRGGGPEKPTNAKQVFLATFGRRLTEIFFLPYTRKMWGVDAAELDPSIGRRIGLRLDRNDDYFDDSFQALPSNGYTALIGEMLRHERISVRLEQPFSKPMLHKFAHCFLAIAPDEFFDYRHGRLPYRSIKFHTRQRTRDQDAPVVNFTDTSRFTRSTQWDLLPNSRRSNTASHTVTLEEPCDPSSAGGEQHYPLRNRESRRRLNQYRRLARPFQDKLTFYGRVGLFAYLDMVPAIELHLKMAAKFAQGR